MNHQVELFPNTQAAYLQGTNILQHLGRFPLNTSLKVIFLSLLAARYLSVGRLKYALSPKSTLTALLC